MTEALKLKVVTPDGSALDVACDSVILPLAEENGTGSIGIRRGHIKAQLAIGEGNIIAKTHGKAIAEIRIMNGFALVENDVVTIITDSVIRHEEGKVNT